MTKRLTSPAPARVQLQSFRAEVHWQDGDAIVALRGELDCATAPALSGLLASILDQQPQRLILDLSSLAFIDCAGIGPIAQARRSLPAYCPLILRSPSRMARKLFAVTRLDQVCDVQLRLADRSSPAVSGRGPQ